MAARNVEILDKAPASRKLSRDDAQRIAADATTIHIARGKKVVVHTGGRQQPGGTADDVLDAMLGSTGNLRSPLIVVGDTVVVGFNEAVFDEVFA